MIDAIFTNCQELTEVNIGGTSHDTKSNFLTEAGVGIFCEKISPKLKKVSLGGCQVRNNQIKTLIKRFGDAL